MISTISSFVFIHYNWEWLSYLSLNTDLFIYMVYSFKIPLHFFWETNNLINNTKYEVVIIYKYFVCKKSVLQ